LENYDWWPQAYSKIESPQALGQQSCTLHTYVCKAVDSKPDMSIIGGECREATRQYCSPGSIWAATLTSLALDSCWDTTLLASVLWAVRVLFESESVSGR
jgi:hypothetical protein